MVNKSYSKSPKTYIIVLISTHSCMTRVNEAKTPGNIIMDSKKQFNSIRKDNDEWRLLIKMVAEKDTIE